MGETIEMSGKERERLVELKRVEAGEQTLVEASLRLGLSYRQTKRWMSRLRSEGDAGLVHRSRGRASNRRRPAEERERCLEIYRDRLEGFGPTLASEQMAERWNLEVDHETLRRWLIAEGLWQVRRRRSKHRRWRPRKKHFGELVQVDGSHHDWFGTGQRCCLLAMIDDATGRRMTSMAAEETTEAAMRLLWRWVERYGRPRTLYVDKKSVYITLREPTIEEQLAGEEPATVFGKACQKLDIALLKAHSPQAKGRVERSHRVYQDRWVKQISIEGLQTFDEANRRLSDFDEGLNERFAIAPHSAADFHRPVPSRLDLADVFAVESDRVVQNDWTVRFANAWYQITGPKRRLPPAKSKVQVLERLDGEITIEYRGRRVDYEPLTERPESPSAKSREVEKKARPERPRPAPDHPWRQPISRRAPALATR